MEVWVSDLEEEIFLTCGKAETFMALSKYNCAWSEWLKEKVKFLSGVSLIPVPIAFT
jgi:hypothetical protein